MSNLSDNAITIYVLDSQLGQLSIKKTITNWLIWSKMDFHHNSGS